MAKRENEEEFLGGLSTGIPYGASKNARNGRAAGNRGADSNPRVNVPNELSAYMQDRPERRSEKFNILITPSIRKKMEKAVKAGEAKNMNDLINVLLEQHFALDDAIKSGQLKTQEDLRNFVVSHYINFRR